MTRLSCPVRECGRPLQRSGDQLLCPTGHAFDRARQGYWNLLQPQDSRSATPGDARAALLARERWLDAGHGNLLASALVSNVDRLGLPEGAGVLDLGCGNGFFLSRLAAGRTYEAYGVDLSAEALKRAARRFPRATWLVANADRRIPLLDGTCSLATSIFGRRPTRELARVLAPGGNLLVVVPAADDLIELRHAALGRALSIDRIKPAVAALSTCFELVGQERSAHREHLEREEIADALLMSYRAGRTRLLDRVGGIQDLEVTVAADILVFRPRRISLCAPDPRSGIQAFCGSTDEAERHVQEDVLLG